MDIKLTDRIQLKEYFKKNNIPKATDFAEFIDASLNQRDDGIVKLPGDPLSIEAIGDDQSVQKIMHFYRKLSEQDPVWSLNLNARNEEKVFRGLNVSAGDGKSRLFIEESSGNVGIGTVTPKALAHVAGDVALGTNEPNQRFILSPGTGSGGDSLQITVDNEKGEWDFTKGIAIKRDGNLEIRGNAISQGLIFDTDRKDHLLKNGALYKYEGSVNLAVDNSFMIRNSEGKVSFEFSKTGQLRATNGVQLGEYLPNQRFIWCSSAKGEYLQLVADNGGNGDGTWNWAEGIFFRREGSKVGIGTNKPSKKLHVDRGELVVRSSHDQTTPDIAAFYANNMTQGIGIGYNRIQALGSDKNPDQDLVLVTKGKGMIKANDRIPVQLVRFANLGDTVNYNTGYSASEYGAAIVGFNTNGQGTHIPMPLGLVGHSMAMQVYMYISNNTWFIRADLTTRYPGENWMVDVMFISNALCSIKGY